MASSIASSIRTFVTAITTARPENALEALAYGQAYFPEYVDVPTPGYAETISTSAPSSVFDRQSVSTVTQLTMSDDDIMPDDSVSMLTSRLEALKAPTHEPVAPRYGALEQDAEGKETRKEMMARRRKECSADEVDVALAPVLKIPVNYVFYPEQYKRFREMFPRVTPDSGLAFCHHDHPVAHTATLVGIRQLQSRLRPGELVLDVHGNPNANEQFNEFQSRRLRKRPGLPSPPVINTLVEMNHHSDAVRRITKWGPSHRFGIPRYREGSMASIEPKLYDTFLSVHTLYYYSMYEVNKLLSSSPHSRMLALVNYSPEQTGTLYGELKFSKNDGLTRQVSPNGEAYTHPDVDRWFQCNSFRGATQELGSGIAWTSTCIGGPLYIIEITACPWELARRHTYEPPSAPTLVVGKNSTLLGLVKLGENNVQLRITNHGLASELRHFMTMRDRNDPQVFKDLCVKARRATSPDLVTGSRQFVVSDGDLSDHIVYAYLVDAPGEMELLEGVKLLRGDLLKPHSDALKLDGKDKNYGWFKTTWFVQSIVGRPAPEFALGGRHKSLLPGLLQHNTPRSAGLLPSKRT